LLKSSSVIRIFVTAVCFTLTLSLAGQKGRKQTVALNNGSRIVGDIVTDSSDYLEIKVYVPQTIRITKAQVSFIEPVVYPVKVNQKTNGYFIHLSASILTGINDLGNTTGYGFHLSNGYQFKNGFGVGIGSGLEKMEITIIPLYADVRYYPLKTRISPFAVLKTGYGFAASDKYSGQDFNNSPVDTKGGFLFNGVAGISFFTWQRTALSIGMGYRYQKITISQEQYWWNGPTTKAIVTHLNRIELQLGLTFR
jgi:hypothetical protein